jgi:hypothetical protein
MCARVTSFVNCVKLLQSETILQSGFTPTRNAKQVDHAVVGMNQMQIQKTSLVILVFSLGMLAQQPVLLNPTSTQTIVQPATTWLTVNDFAQIRFADQFAWAQFPSIPLTISSTTCPQNVCTVTINSVRGISSYSYTNTKHYLWLDATGTAERVLITNTTCPAQPTCTVSFAFGLNHGKGYSLGTATNGFQEALVDALTTTGTVNPVTGMAIAGSPYNSALSVYTFNAPFSIDNIAGAAAPIIVNFNGATVQCFTSGTDCILVNSSTNINGVLDTIIQNGLIVPFPGLGRTGNGTTVGIHDRGQHTTIQHMTFGTTQSAPTDVFDNLVVTENDENFDFANNSDTTASGVPMKCDAHWCGAALLVKPTNFPGPSTIRRNQLDVNCKGNAVDYQSGNGAVFEDNVVENFNQFGFRYIRNGLQDITDRGGNYFESGTCTNPDFGQSGFVVDWAVKGEQFITSGVQNGGDTPPLFLNDSNPTKVYAFYVVGTDSSGRKTTPIYAGKAFVNTSVPKVFSFMWLPFGTAAVSYDVLASDVTSDDDNITAPWGQSGIDNAPNWAVATGFVCSTSPCTLSVNVPLSLSGYTVSYSNWWSPDLPYWPAGGLFLDSNGVCTSAASDCVTTHYGSSRGVAVSTAPFAGNYYYGEVLTSLNQDTASSGYDAVAIRRYKLISQATLGGTSGGLLVNPIDDGQTLTSRKGKFIFTTNSWSGTGSCNITLFDSQPQKTFANAVNRPSLDSTDSCIGYDASPSTMSFMNPTSFTFYVNNLMDNATFLERLTSALKTFQVNVSIPRNALSVGGNISQTGVTFANLGSPAAGAQQFCTDCEVTATSCSTATPASCVCISGGTGAFAKRMNFQSSGLNWYCQ